MFWYSFTRPPHYLHTNWLFVWSLIHKMLKSRFCSNPRIQDNWIMFLPPKNHSLDLKKRCIRTFAHWFELQFWFEWKILCLLEVTSNWSCIQKWSNSNSKYTWGVEFQISTQQTSTLSQLGPMGLCGTRAAHRAHVSKVASVSYQFFWDSLFQ